MFTRDPGNMATARLDQLSTKLLKPDVEIEFQRPIHPLTLGQVVCHILKLVLYARNQVPTSLDKLLQDGVDDEEEDDDDGEGTEQDRPSTHHRTGSRFSRKSPQAKVVVLQQCLSSVLNLCRQWGPGIRYIKIVLGRSVVSPAAAYCINLAPGLVDVSVKPLSKDSLSRYITKCLVDSIIISDDESLPIAPTKISVIICAPRDIKQSSMAVPKLSLKAGRKEGNLQTISLVAESVRENDLTNKLEFLSIQDSPELEQAHCDNMICYQVVPTFGGFKDWQQPRPPHASHKPSYRYSNSPTDDFLDIIK